MIIACWRPVYFFCVFALLIICFVGNGLPMATKVFRNQEKDLCLNLRAPLLPLIQGYPSLAFLSLCFVQSLSLVFQMKVIYHTHLHTFVSILSMHIFPTYPCIYLLSECACLVYQYSQYLGHSNFVATNQDIALCRQSVEIENISLYTALSLATGRKQLMPG